MPSEKPRTAGPEVTTTEEPALPQPHGFSRNPKKKRTDDGTADLPPEKRPGSGESVTASAT